MALATASDLTKNLRRNGALLATGLAALNRPSGHEVTRLGRTPTVRRIWLAAPFLSVALFGVPSLLSLIYEDVFGLGSAQRGAVAAGVEPLQIVGVLFAMPAVATVSEKRPDFLLRFVAVVGVIDGLLLVALANAPNVAVAIATHALLAASVGTLALAFFALVSLIAPPRVRSAAFTTMSLFAIPGVALVLPVLGATSDALGIQTSVLTLVPVAVACGLILASAARFVRDDIEAVRSESVSHAAATVTTYVKKPERTRPALHPRAARSRAGATRPKE